MMWREKSFWYPHMDEHLKILFMASGKPEDDLAVPDIYRLYSANESTLSQVVPKQASFHANVAEALVLLGHAVINGRRNAEHFIRGYSQFWIDAGRKCRKWRDECVQRRMVVLRKTTWTTVAR